MRPATSSRAGRVLPIGRTSLLGIALTTFVMLGAPKAQDLDLDFETEPPGRLTGAAAWRISGGNPGGYLSMTDALNSQLSAVIFPLVDTGGAFSLGVDLRVGGGTDRPADGISFSLTRLDDPVLVSGEGWVPEEGTTTGLSIGLDEWFNGGDDVVGMSVRIDNELVEQIAFPVLNGEVDDVQSLQTGPAGVDADLLGWARLNIVFEANGLLTISYKGREVFHRVVDYRVGLGHLVIGGRTGGANAYHHLDNLTFATRGQVGGGAECGDFDLGFDVDTVIFQLFGAAQRRNEAGHPGHYLSITDALNSQRGAIVFPLVNTRGAFSFGVDLRVGGGTDRPADGFSFSLVRPEDPVLDDGEGWSGAAEEGTTTGLSIGFDEWFSGGDDVIGMSVRIDNELAHQIAFPVLNGEVDDPLSLQTGPAGVDADLLGWARLSIVFETDGKLTITYKGLKVFDQVVNHEAGMGHLVIGGRTGGANANHHLDNISFTTAPPDVTCDELDVSGPADSGPGVYTVTARATAPPGETLFYFFGAENRGTGDGEEVGPMSENMFSVPLTQGTWTFSAAAGVDGACPVFECAPVTIVVGCREEIDRVTIQGAAEARPGESIDLVAGFSGADPGTEVSHAWRVVSGAGQILGSADGPSVEVTSNAIGEVTVEVVAGDGVCGDFAAARHAIRFVACPLASGITCGGIDVSGPADNDPGTYRVMVQATAPPGESLFRTVQIEDFETGERSVIGPVTDNSIDFELASGVWLVSASVGVDVDCPFSECGIVPVVVGCQEEVDRVEIEGPEESVKNDPVELLAHASGADAGSQVSYAWRVVGGAGRIMGSADGPSAEVTSSRPGRVTVEARAGDGICGDFATATHTILFLACPANPRDPGVACEGIDLRGPGNNRPGIYRVTVRATGPAGKPLYYFLKYENPRTGQRDQVGPVTGNTFSLPLFEGVWIFSPRVGTDPDCSFVDCPPVRVVVGQPPEIGPFKRGDCNADGEVNISDAVCTLEWLFLGRATPSCIAAANTNGDQAVNISDPASLLGFLFLGGLAPVDPHPLCGPGELPADELLGCKTAPSTCQ